MILCPLYILVLNESLHFQYRCIKSLLLSKDRNHHLVCGTIAGFTPSHPNPSWVNLCLQLSKETASPELCAVFTFFATSNWQDVIQSELKMREKLLIALRYLNDTALVEYVDAEGRQTIQKGSLDGLLFTGLSTEAVDIFSEYVDRTGDIQTASLVLSIVVPKRFKDTKVEEWIESYRKYLDQLQLFHIRAMFDIQHAKHAEGEFVIPPQVSISCDYCNQSISHSSSATLSKGNLPSMSPKVKLTVCPHCCKPLPRCSLCLLTLGAPIEKLSGNKGSKSYLPLEFARWITWCQNCHHGGHAVHLMEWFAKYDICPISDCNCQCAQL
ncbi:hypothetical protein HMI55_001359 [Coelomomyces lativittatus]|nr:hypothetical protein HMI55_001359 [Coelomomyces lativittatus]